MLQFHCRTDSSVGKIVGTESRRSWVQVPFGQTSLTSKLSHRRSINIILLHSDKLFPKLYIIVSRRVRKLITPKCKSEGAEMSLRVVSRTWWKKGGRGFFKIFCARLSEKCQHLELFSGLDYLCFYFLTWSA